jgi:hypothetical protein
MPGSTPHEASHTAATSQLAFASQLIFIPLLSFIGAPPLHWRALLPAKV